LPLEVLVANCPSPVKPREPLVHWLREPEPFFVGATAPVSSFVVIV
jgi:hypothetical protein